MSEPSGADPVGSPDAPLTLASVAKGISNRVDAIPRMWLTGEILNLFRRSGTSFCDLVDPDTASGKPPTLTLTISTRMLDELPMQVGTGDRVTALVKLSFWKGSGKIGATVLQLRPAGDGALLERIEALRQTLGKEGLFAPEHKKPLPPLPKLIGLITGANTHAESDVLTRTRERWPAARFKVIHTPVQGPDCAPAVKAALATLDLDPEVEVIVIARGGGSVSELLPFSDELLVRAVFSAVTPVVSAIGHEPDHPILDDVSDARAGTPTQAASLIVADIVGMLADLDRMNQRAQEAALRRLETAARDVAQLASRPVLVSPSTVLDQHENQLLAIQATLASRVRTTLDLAESRTASLSSALHSLSPAGTLARGYAVVTLDDGSAVPAVGQVQLGTGLNIRTATGRLHALTDTEPAEPLDDKEKPQ